MENSSTVTDSHSKYATTRVMRGITSLTSLKSPVLNPALGMQHWDPCVYVCIIGYTMSYVLLSICMYYCLYTCIFVYAICIVYTYVLLGILMYYCVYIRIIGYTYVLLGILMYYSVYVCIIVCNYNVIPNDSIHKMQIKLRVLLVH
jgi:hypothetical protein